MILTIELVPESSFLKNLRSEVSTSMWNKIRKSAYKKADYKCEICGGRGNRYPVECHEIWEFDDEKHIQKLKGVIALCPFCHEVKHIGLAEIRGNYQRARNHFMKVNNIDSYEIADNLIQNAFRKWWERGYHKWTLNLDWLKENET